MLFFFLFISLTNLAIGYIVAVKFHAALFPEPICERELVRSSDDAEGGMPSFTIDASQMPRVNRQPTVVALPAKDVEPLAETAPAESAPADMPPADEFEPSRAPAGAPNLDPPAEENVETQSEIATPETLTAVSVDDFMRGISDFRAQLSALDQRVRNCAKSPDTRQIEGCVQDFREANSRYLEHTSEANSRLQQVEPSESESATNAREAMQQALATQAEEVRNTEDKLSQLDIAADPEGSCEALLNTAYTLASSNDRLRDELELAKRELTTDAENGPQEDENTQSLDELTQIPGRPIFDSELRQQLKQCETYCLAVADVDHCGQLNLSYGPSVTDEVLKAIAKIVAASARGECRAARYSGQQFAVFFPGHQPEEAALVVETIRQIIDLTQFKHEETQLDVSVSVTVISGDGNDSLLTLEQRVKEGIAATKSEERNQSYQFQNGKLEPIAPPELDLQVNSYEV